MVGGHRGGRGEERSGPYPSASGHLLDQGMTRPLGRPGSLLQGMMLRVDIGSGTFPCIGLHFFRGFKAADASGDIREVWDSLRSRHAWKLHIKFLSVLDSQAACGLHRVGPILVDRRLGSFHRPTEVIFMVGPLRI